MNHNWEDTPLLARWAHVVIKKIKLVLVSGISLFLGGFFRSSIHNTSTHHYLLVSCSRSLNFGILDILICFFFFLPACFAGCWDPLVTAGIRE